MVFVRCLGQSPCVDTRNILALGEACGLNTVAGQKMRRNKLDVLFRLRVSIVFVVALGSLGGTSG